MLHALVPFLILTGTLVGAHAGYRSHVPQPHEVETRTKRRDQAWADYELYQEMLEES